MFNLYKVVISWFYIILVLRDADYCNIEIIWSNAKCFVYDSNENDIDLFPYC